MDEYGVTPILELPDELILIILAMVPFKDNRDYQSLRLVSRHWDDIFRQNVKSLPKQVTQQQFLHLYQVRNVITPARNSGWPVLRSLSDKSQRLQAWIELLLPYGHRHVVTLGIILIDAICSTRPIYRHKGHLGEEIGPMAAMLACSRLVRLVLPPQALLLIRYVVTMTDTALLIRHGLFPTAQLSYLRMSEVELDANRLCRFLVYEAKLLAISTDPPDLLQDKRRVLAFYDAQYNGAKALRGHLESPNLIHHVHRAPFLLHLGIDRLIKHLVPLSPTNVSGEQDAERCENDAGETDRNPRDSTRQKLATLFQELRERNGVIRDTFRNKRKADLLLKGIDLPTIVTGMRKEYAAVTKLVDEGLVLSAAAEVRLLDLDGRPKSPYMDT